MRDGKPTTLRRLVYPCLPLTLASIALLSSPSVVAAQAPVVLTRITVASANDPINGVTSLGADGMKVTFHSIEVYLSAVLGAQ